MFRHVALWKFDDDEDPGLTRQVAIQIKAGFEELAYEIHGIQSVDVCIDPVRLAACNGDIFLECVFEDRDAFLDFLDNPRRKALRKLVESCTEECLCMDFEADGPELI